ncbi:hypothetical protein Y046_3851 [Burkholderia pseudomallei MSHR2990]|nr:hypothetical protein Y046_3851 [Burkholderia pseudomallei MSHR2990]
MLRLRAARLARVVQRDGQRLPPRVEAAERLRVRDRHPRERAAMPLAPRDERRLALQRHRVRDEAPPRLQARPASVEHAFAAHAAADEHRVGRAQARERVGRAARDELERRHAERVAVVLDEALPVRMRLDRDRPATRVRAHPFDTDRPAARADVPQQFARRGREPRERERAQIALRDLAVVAIRVVRQARGERQARRVGARAAFDRDDVQRGRARVAPGIGARVETPLERAAEMLEHAHRARPEAARDERAGDRGGRRAVRAQHEQPPARIQVPMQRRERPADERHRVDVLQRPAGARGRERQRRRRGQHAPFVRRERAREQRADAEQHRIAAREHAHARRTPREERREIERLRPRRALRAMPRGQHREMPLAAHHHRRVGERAPRRLAEPRVSVVADAHHRQPRGHPSYSIVFPSILKATPALRIPRSGVAKKGIIQRPSTGAPRGPRGNAGRAAPLRLPPQL